MKKYKSRAHRLAAWGHQEGQQDFVGEVCEKATAAMQEVVCNAHNSKVLGEKIEAISQAIDELSAWVNGGEMNEYEFPLVVKFFKTIGKVPVRLRERSIEWGKVREATHRQVRAEARAREQKAKQAG